MRKSVFVIAVIAAACSSVAFAGEVKKDKAPAEKATTMSDAQMDKVTAGAFIVQHDQTNTTFPNWSEQGQINAGHGFQGHGPFAARCIGCGL